MMMMMMMMKHETIMMDHGKLYRMKKTIEHSADFALQGSF